MMHAGFVHQAGPGEMGDGDGESTRQVRRVGSTGLKGRRLRYRIEEEDRHKFGGTFSFPIGLGQVHLRLSSVTRHSRIYVMLVN
jgi:hypothetical protein